MTTERNDEVCGVCGGDRRIGNSFGLTTTCPSCHGNGKRRAEAHGFHDVTKTKPSHTTARQSNKAAVVEEADVARDVRRRSARDRGPRQHDGHRRHEGEGDPSDHRLRAEPRSVHADLHQEDPQAGPTAGLAVGFGSAKRTSLPRGSRAPDRVLVGSMARDGVAQGRREHAGAAGGDRAVRRAGGRVGAPRLGRPRHPRRGARRGHGRRSSRRRSSGASPSRGSRSPRSCCPW